MGDRVLCAIAQRLEGCVRETDTVARMGGDEFTILLTEIESEDAIARKVEQILAVIGEPLDAESDATEMPSCSIGVASYPADGKDSDTLLSRADSDMYSMKKHQG